jgi:hypothetical protein
MRTFASCLAIFGGAALSILVSSASLADERLIMPYACKAVAGKVELTPAPDRAYPIFGAADHQLYTACAPKKPELCRSWMLHRFDLDCAGTKVSWLSVVDAMTKWRPHRAWVSEGRLYVRIWPWWARDEGAPCSFGLRFRYGPWEYAPRWPCGGGRSWDDSGVVSLPAGFAPTLGIGVQLANMPGPKTAPTGALTGAALVRHQNDTTEPNAAVREGAITGSKTAASATNSRAAPVSQTQSAADRDVEITSSIPPFDRPAGHGLSLEKVGVGVAGLLLILAVLLLWTNPLEQGRALVFLNRGVASRPRTRFAAVPAQEKSADARRNLGEDGEWLPSTRVDALRVLGANPETPKDVLKKTINRLRQTWHPDLAHTDEDRRMRERRLKQINVAWDIVTGKRGPRSH